MTERNDGTKSVDDDGREQGSGLVFFFVCEHTYGSLEPIRLLVQ